MSTRRAVVVLGLVTSLTVGCIGFVHREQNLDRERMYQGVLRDIEREKAREARVGSKGVQ